MRQVKPNVANGIGLQFEARFTFITVVLLIRNPLKVIITGLDGVMELPVLFTYGLLRTRFSKPTILSCWRRPNSQLYIASIINLDNAGCNEVDKMVESPAAWQHPSLLKKRKPVICSIRKLNYTD